MRERERGDTAEGIRKLMLTLHERVNFMFYSRAETLQPELMMFFFRAREKKFFRNNFPERQSHHN